ncbi:MAG: Lrp/AsnC family transcriptional regulator [Pseudomonadota bacterium]
MTESVSLDRIDRAILHHLQLDAAQTHQELAERVNLSTNACWRRVRRLEDAGFIDARVALLNRQALGVPVTVFVALRTTEHNESWLRQFAAGVATVPEVMEFYRMSGDTDYLLKVVVRDIADYDRVYKRLISIAPLSDVSSSFAMECLKSTTALPLPD